MFIIWGSTVRDKQIGTGSFTCPHCKDEQMYQRKLVVQYFTLFFISVFETGTLGDFVECLRCHIRFQPIVLRRGGPLLKLPGRPKPFRRKSSAGKAIRPPE
jgi:hypothetical protein